MLGWLLLGALIGLAVITIRVSFLNVSVAEEKLKNAGIMKAKCKDICISDSVIHIKLDAMDTNGCDKQVEFIVDNYDTSEIRNGITIYT